MRKLFRKPSESPDFLTNKIKKSDKSVQQDFTEKWKKRISKFHKNEIKNSPSFNWYNLDIKLRPLLIEFTDLHCSFCDCKFTYDFSEHFPIEHFEPKIQFPEKAFEWNNLFAICNICNTMKRDKFDNQIIKPDLLDYNFEDYFVFKYQTGEIEPNPNASIINQEKAKTTIKIYNLNRNGLCKDRIDEYNFYEEFKNQQNDLNYYSHRNFIEQVI